MISVPRRLAAALALFAASQALLALLYRAVDASRVWQVWAAFLAATAAFPVLWEVTAGGAGFALIGFRLPRRPVRDCAVALVVAAVLAGYAAVVFRLLSQELPHRLVWADAGFFALQWGVVALGEETLYRGLLQRRLAQCLGAAAGLVVASAVWALVGHIRAPLIENLLIRFPTGLVLGWLYARSGSLYPAMLAHWALNLAVT